MIEKSFPSLKPKVVPKIYEVKKFLTPVEKSNALSRKISDEEWSRRDEIVRTLWRTHLFNVGDTVYPTSESAYKKYGAFMVKGMVSSYRDLPITEKWPDDDEPFVLQIMCIKERTTILNCTVGYVSKQNLHEVTC